MHRTRLWEARYQTHHPSGRTQHPQSSPLFREFIAANEVYNKSDEAGLRRR